MRRHQGDPLPGRRCPARQERHLRPPGRLTRSPRTTRGPAGATGTDPEATCGPTLTGPRTSSPASAGEETTCLDKAFLVAREGDELVVTKLDRLGRSLENLIELSKELQDRGVGLVVLDQGIDTSTAVGRMFFPILGAIAEFEHALMSERTMDGLEAARARGRTGGQKPKLGPRQVQLSRKMYDSGDYTVQQIADGFGVTRPTIYRRLAKA
ncbi:recombinase family protein [Streptosporangium sp. CA-135522]|uniref:recombinase family protein n=1 Tax=Streptosporangium sp. CA-135522 TaxID=3240072 RepID=UPI003D8F6E41